LSNTQHATRRRVANDVSHLNTMLYNLSLVRPAPPGGIQRFHLGEKIQLRWLAPKEHSRKDWIGLYRVKRSFNSPEKEVAKKFLFSLDRINRTSLLRCLPSVDGFPCTTKSGMERYPLSMLGRSLPITSSFLYLGRIPELSRPEKLPLNRISCRGIRAFMR
jgi:hypothetical protein